MESVAAARRKMLAEVERLASESVPLETASGRVLARSIGAKRDQPRFDPLPWTATRFAGPIFRIVAR